MPLRTLHKRSSIELPGSMGAEEAFQNGESELIPLPCSPLSPELRGARMLERRLAALSFVQGDGKVSKCCGRNCASRPQGWALCLS